MRYARSSKAQASGNERLHDTMTTSIGSSYPLPVSITVRNVFPPLAILNNVSTPPVENDTAPKDDERHSESDNNIQSKQQTTNSSSIKQTLSSKISSSSVEYRCALVSREVLLRLRLDIVTKPILSSDSSNDTEEIDNDTSNRSSKETLVYSSEQPSSTAHPRWDHVDEYLSTLFNDKDPIQNKNCNVLYARFVILSDTTDNNNPSSVDLKECILAEIPLHPSKLRRLPTITSNEDTNSTQPQQQQSNSNTSMIIPNPLPPNTILLHYNDGYTRTIPNIYWTLVQRGIICESIVDPVIKRYGSGEEYTATNEKDRDDDRFEDKAFNVLPGDDTESKKPDASDEEKLDESYSSNQQDDIASARDNSQTTDDKVFDLLGEAEGDSSTAQPIQATPKLTDTISIPDTSDAAPNLVEKSPIGEQSTKGLSQENEETPQSLLPELPPLSISADCQTSQDEIEELRRLVKMEQHLLEEEQRSIQQVSV